MDEFLTKLNIVKKNNYINELEKDNLKNKVKVEKYVENFKKEITNQELEKRKYLKQIDDLTKINKELENTNKSYKFILDKIPNFIIKLFAGKKNIGGYLNG